LGLFGSLGPFGWSSLFGSFEELKRPDALEKPDKPKDGLPELLGFINSRYFGVAVLPSCI
jgi:hypothetical protein